MLPSRLTGYLRSLRADDPSSDAALLARFEKDRDAEAFELLVWRHGSLVLGVCRRMLRDEHAAEDAFQATFLILSRRAGSIRGSLAPWLHSVARRVCLRLQKRRPELLTVDPPGRAEPDALQNRELQSVLDAEIARLPEKLRRVVILCYLEDRTAAETALELGIPRGTVLSRLDAARRKLQAALAHRGVAPVAILTVSLIHATPSAALVQTAQTAALAFTSGTSGTPITQLAFEVLHMTTLKWIAGTALGLVLLAFATTGVGLFNANGPATSQAVAQAPAEALKPINVLAPDDAKQEKLKEQHRQIAVLELNERELKDRIDSLNAKIAKEQSVKDAEVSARALMQAIDNIDESILRVEVQLPPLKAALDEAKAQLRPDKDYKIKLGDIMNSLGPEQEKIKFGRNALYITYRKEMQRLSEDMSKLAKIAGMNDPKFVALKAEAQKLADDFMDTAVPMIVKYDSVEIREVIHARHLEEVRVRQQAFDGVAFFPGSVAKRRGELVERLRKVGGPGGEQKLLEDELQVLREFRKVVLKQKLTLKLESEGVVLPVEPKK